MIYSHVSVAIFLIFVIFLATLLLLLRCLSHFVLVLMLLDLLLLCNIILFVLASIYTGTSSGYVAAVLVLGVAAADTAVGLGLFILYFKATNLVSIKNKIGLGLWLYNVCAGCKIEIYLVNLGIRSWSCVNVRDAYNSCRVERINTHFNLCYLLVANGWVSMLESPF